MQSLNKIIFKITRSCYKNHDFIPAVLPRCPGYARRAVRLGISPCQHPMEHKPKEIASKGASGILKAKLSVVEIPLAFVPHSFRIRGPGLCKGTEDRPHAPSPVSLPDLLTIIILFPI